MNNFELPISPNPNNPPLSPSGDPASEVITPVSKSCFSPLSIVLALIIILLSGATGYLLGFFSQSSPAMETSENLETTAIENGQVIISEERFEQEAGSEVIDQQNWINTVRGPYSLSHPTDWQVEEVNPESVAYFGGEYFGLYSPEGKVKISITPEQVPMGFGMMEFLDSENFHLDIMGLQTSFPEMVIKSDDGRHSVFVNTKFSNCLMNDPTSPKSCVNWSHSNRMTSTYILINTQQDPDGVDDDITAYEAYQLHKPVIKQILSTLKVEI